MPRGDGLPRFGVRAEEIKRRMREIRRRQEKRAEKEQRRAAETTP
ncbi:hypothetical protein [Sphingopyxis flava]|uniref:Uncharacterized protein n=1 Tax=Sphingopyxis flava TaxID=1507287 RepID=A0A1T5AC36_9SPHN|nr:hypothetical protein [Sphingopyxis flava]SKB32561.1 hypothetical protein SAMN06295937_100391 [Sphingopyxis flava]